MRKATLENKSIITEILMESIKNDPHMFWLTEESRQPNKLKVVIGFIVDEALRKGNVYLNDDHTAIALWCSEKKEKLSFNNLFRNLSFPFKVGIKATISITMKDRMCYNQNPKTGKFPFIYDWRVARKSRKRTRQRLNHPIIDESAKKSIPVYLETANP